MKKFIYRTIIFLFPIIFFFGVLITAFYVLDPFKITKEYDYYYNSPISYNEDFIGTERFLKSECKYDSYILGSSRAGTGFLKEDWDELISNTSSSFSYTASNETIFGMHGKLQLMDKQKCKLENILLVFDTDVTFKTTVNSKGHLFIKHPQVSNERRRDFELEYLKDFIFTGFFIRYFDYLLFKKERPYMKGFLLFDGESEAEIYKPFRVKLKEKLIKNDEDLYYKKRSKKFYNRPNQEISNKKIVTASAIILLEDIKRILAQNGSNYDIVISPLYNQKKLNVDDINTLINIFGKDNVHDYSGKNEITNNQRNYFEASHYRPHIGKKILNRIYAQ